jgi:hypothetical protein
VPLQLEGEEQAGELRLTIGPHRLVAPRRVQIVEVDRAVPRGNARQRDDARVRPIAQQRHEVGRQGEVAEIVGAELQLEAIRGGLPPRRGHHGGVVDQQIETPSLPLQPCGEVGDGLEAGEIDLLEPDIRGGDFGSDSRDSLRAFPRIAAREDDLTACSCKFEGILESETTGTGDDG